MKLINKTIFYYLLVCIPILVGAGIISYYQIKSAVKESSDDSMWEEVNGIEERIRAEGKPMGWVGLNPQSFMSIDTTGKTGYEFTDVLIVNSEKELEPARILDVYYPWKGSIYRIHLVRSVIEEEDLVESLSAVILIIIAGMVLAFFVTNLFVSRILWKPFYKTVETLNVFELKKYSAHSFEKSKTKEFAQLNAALNKMTAKMHTDFLVQKEFTENASHEMQTPLAIIRAKVDLLMQSKNLKEEEMRQLEGIDASVNKLSSLNKALLLLAKIENDQFKDVAEVSLDQVSNKVLANYEDLIQSKNISVTKNVSTDSTVKMNPGLADILITNLIQNAIRHNTEHGTIKVELKANEFVIANSGPPLHINPEDLFVRFKKNDASKDSMGLGLSIVKGIVDLYEMKINYSFKNDLHIFTITTHL